MSGMRLPRVAWFLAAGLLATPAVADSRPDPQDTARAQQGIYDFHRQNTVRQPAFIPAQPSSRPARLPPRRRG